MSIRWRILVAVVLLISVGYTVSATESEEVHTIDDITISADSEKTDIRITPAETVISPEETEVPGIAQSIADLVTRVPVFDFRGSTNLVPDDDTLFMRGFDSKRFTTAIDGLTIRKTGGRKSSHIVDYALLPPWLFETIEIKPGPHFTAYPGKSIGGVLNLVSKPPVKRDTLKPDTTVDISYGSYNTQNHTIHTSGNAGNVTYDIGYQKYQTDGYLRHTEADIGTAFSRIGYLLPSDGIISFSASITDADRGTTVKNDPDTPETEYDQDYPVVTDTTFSSWQKPTWDKEATAYRLNFRQPTPLGTISLKGFYSEESRDYSYLDWIDRNDHSQGIQDASWETRWKQQGGKLQDIISLGSHEITIGGDLEQCFDGYGRVALWNSVPEDKKRIEIMAGYLQDTWQISPNLTLTAGSRYEDVTIQVSNQSSSGSYYITGKPAWIERNWNEFLPKSFLTWNLGSITESLRDTSVSAGVSRIWRAPDYHGDYNPQGRPSGAWLEPEHGYGLDLVFNRRIIRDITLKLNYARYDIRDFIASNSKYAEFSPPRNGSYDFVGQEYKDYKINLYKVIQQTVEFQAGGHIIDSLSFYLGYAFLDFDSKGEEPAGKTECDQRARHRVTAGLDWALLDNTTLILDYLFQDDQITEVSEEVAPNQWTFTQVPIDAYHLVDVAVKQTLISDMGPLSDASLKLYVNNLFDKEYVNSEGYPATDRIFGASLTVNF